LAQKAGREREVEIVSLLLCKLVLELMYQQSWCALNATHGVMGFEPRLMLMTTHV